MDSIVISLDLQKATIEITQIYVWQNKMVVGKDEQQIRINQRKSKEINAP
jgi:hypothetical protein